MWPASAHWPKICAMKPVPPSSLPPSLLAVAATYAMFHAVEYSASVRDITAPPFEYT